MTVRSAELVTGIVTFALAVAGLPFGPLVAPGLALNTVTEGVNEEVTPEPTARVKDTFALLTGNEVAEVHVRVFPDSVHGIGTL